MTTPRQARLVLVFLLLGYAFPAQAHSRSESYSNWYQSGTLLSGTVTMPTREVTRLPAYAGTLLTPAELLAEHLRQQVSVYDSTGPCAARLARVLQSAPDFVRIEMQFRCTRSAARIEYRAMFDAAPSHVHYAKYYADGKLRGEFLLTDAASTWIIPSSGAAAEAHSFAAFMVLGMQHISGGPDHVAFLIGVLLIAGTLRRSVIAATGFTLGHSASLAAAVLGYVRADSQTVEALIGFTVVLVALEYFVIRQHQSRGLLLTAGSTAWFAGSVALAAGVITPRTALAYFGIGLFAYSYLALAARIPSSARSASLFIATSCFGLLHGLGFAGFLLQSGLLSGALVRPLLGFNIGVELGQILLILLALSVARLARRLTTSTAAEALAAGLCGVGVFWFIGRTLGL